MLISDLAASRDGIVVEIAGTRGSIWLDRPKAMNALTLPMARSIHAALDMLAAEPEVALVTIGSTRPGVFCAGGDIRMLRQAVLDGRRADLDAFFRAEYAVNQLISGYGKPYVAIIDGICMGGGMGISVHGRHRVATENLVMAMPETGIGFFPDIGASFFLNRLPGHIGLYLALTGARLDAADALYCGLATAFIPEGSLQDLRAALSAVHSNEVGETIARFSTHPPMASRLAENRAAIDRCFSAGSLEGIMARLRAEATSFGKSAMDLLSAASPHALQITLDLMRKNRGRDLASCLRADFRLGLTARHHPDFAEGVRAALVDKDRAPRWQ